MLALIVLIAQCAYLYYWWATYTACEKDMTGSKLRERMAATAGMIALCCWCQCEWRNLIEGALLYILMFEVACYICSFTGVDERIHGRWQDALKARR